MFDGKTCQKELLRAFQLEVDQSNNSVSRSQMSLSPVIMSRKSSPPMSFLAQTRPTFVQGEFVGVDDDTKNSNQHIRSLSFEKVQTPTRQRIITNNFHRRELKKEKIARSCLNEQGIKFFTSKVVTPVSQEQVKYLQDSDDDMDIETYKRVVWAEFQELMKDIPEQARKFKWMWKVFVKQNPIHAEKELFGVAMKFVETHIEELGESWEMFSIVRTNFIVYVTKFGILSFKQLAQILGPIKKFIVQEHGTNER